MPPPLRPCAGGWSARWRKVLDPWWSGRPALVTARGRNCGRQAPDLDASPTPRGRSPGPVSQALKCGMDSEVGQPLYHRSRNLDGRWKLPCCPMAPRASRSQDHVERQLRRGRRPAASPDSEGSAAWGCSLTRSDAEGIPQVAIVLVFRPQSMASTRPPILGELFARHLCTAASFCKWKFRPSDLRRPPPRGGGGAHSPFVEAPALVLRGRGRDTYRRPVAR